MSWRPPLLRTRRGRGLLMPECVAKCLPSAGHTHVRQMVRLTPPKDMGQHGGEGREGRRIGGREGRKSRRGSQRGNDRKKGKERGGGREKQKQGRKWDVRFTPG